jgi:uncharacterized protein
VRPRFPPEAQLLRTVLWKRLDEDWVERCTVLRGGRRRSATWILDGTVIGSSEGVPLDIRYAVLCHEDWATAEVAITAMIGNRVRELEVVNEKDRWFVDATESPDLRGSIDADLGFSPATNTLPIRRLGLSVGDSSEIQTAWVRFPELTVEPFPQRYTRLAERIYLYESLTSDFKAQLTVDELGLVVEYQGVWERPAESSAPAAVSDPTG